MLILSPKTLPRLLSLCVDDFEVKYYITNDFNHILEAIETHYICKIDMGCYHFLGFKLDWKYIKGNVTLSMTGYVKNALEKLQHIINKYQQYSLHVYYQIGKI